MFGWAGCILYIDLGKRTAGRLPNDEALRSGFLGGRGINSRILYQETTGGSDAFAPENCIIFGSGPLSGTRAPSTPRCTVTTKSPLTGILGDANFGGFFAPAMKRAGCDHIVIRGVSEEPVYLFITGDDVQFREASELWGRTTAETEAQIKRELGDTSARVVSIGPAGENLVRTACIVHGYNVAGRTGTGAVMGAKRLKAVAVSGTGQISVAHPELLKRSVRRWREKIEAAPLCRSHGTYGSAGPLAMEDSLGILSVRNFTQSGGFPGVENVTATTLQKQYFTGSHSCFGCPVHCIQSYQVSHDGPYRGTAGAKMPEGCTSPCGPSCGNDDAASLFRINSLANEYGIDVLDFGITMSIAMDWYENGVISSSDTDGIPLTWGNHESMVTMLGRIARREGFGNVLAEGAVRAARQIGGQAETFVSHCKGMVEGMIDPRPLKGTALCFATATRGCDHLRGGVVIEIPFKEMSFMSEEEALQTFGTADVLKHDSYNKTAAACHYQDLYTLADSLGICKFVFSPLGDCVTLDDVREMLYAVTGAAMDASELKTAARRIFTQERAFLAREGITRKDDVLQGKWVRGPVPNGPFKGNRIDPEQWEAMLDRYYALRGWDARTGVPSRTALEELGLGDVARDMEQCRAL